MRRRKNRPEGSNWAEFGDGDQIRRMDLLAPVRRLAALHKAREGLALPLSLPLDYSGGSEIVSMDDKPSRSRRNLGNTWE